MTDKDQRAEKLAEELLGHYVKYGKGPCLIPKPGVEMPSCHENDFCACDVHDALIRGYTAGAKRKEEEMTARFQTVIKNTLDGAEELARLLEEEQRKSAAAFEENRILREVIEGAEKYLTSCGYANRGNELEPEYQMLMCFREALARTRKEGEEK